MDKVTRVILLLIAFLSTADAQTLSQLPQATVPLSSNDLVYVVQNGQARQVSVGNLIVAATPQYNSLGVGVPAPAGTGNVNISGQYQINGTPLSASSLTNGTTGSGPVVLGNGNPAITLGNGTGLPPSGITSIGSGHILANATASGAAPADTTATSWLDQAFCSTVGYVLARTTSAWVCSQGIPVNVSWFGIVGDGVTDNTATLQNLITQIITNNAGGTLIFPPGLYCIFSGVSVTNANTIHDVHLVGLGIYPTALSSCGHNATIVTLNTQWSGMRDISVYGYGAFPTDPVFGGTAPTVPAIQLGAACSQCALRNMYVTGGTAAVEIQASGYVLDNVWASFSYGDGSHVFGFVYTLNGGGSINNSHFDMVYPVSQPAYGASISAWSSGTNYSVVGTIVSVTCNSRTFWIQLKTAGTSGGTQPACKAYGANITDNTAVWLLVNAATSYGLQIDTGSIETEVSQTDVTCACSWNVALTNTFAGQAPQQIDLNTITPGAGMSGNVEIIAGTNIRFSDVEASACLATGCIAFFQASSGSGFMFNGIQCLNNIGYCVAVNAGTNTIIANSYATAFHTVAFSIAAGVSNFALTGNIVGTNSGGGDAIQVVTGASNHYTITGNVCAGSVFADGGSGANKLVQASCP